MLTLIVLMNNDSCDAGGHIPGSNLNASRSRGVHKGAALSASQLRTIRRLSQLCLQRGLYNEHSVPRQVLLIFNILFDQFPFVYPTIRSHDILRLDHLHKSFLFPDCEETAKLLHRGQPRPGRIRPGRDETAW